ncbi:MAG: peptide chain release factor N(5)-glutamine methyltransferase [Pseudomonadota bacterium]
MRDSESDRTATSLTLGEALRTGIARLHTVSTSPRADAALLLMHCTGVDHATLIAHDERPLDVVQRARFSHLCERRVRGEPLAYLTGERAFWTLSLEVDANTLIPRPDTETLVHAALARLPAHRGTRCLDLGTGSGAVALALATERPDCEVWASDIDAGALQVARRNADRVGARVHFVSGDWFAALDGTPDTRFDLIASNPPYIAVGDPHLTQGDLRFEPQHALVAGHDGLAALAHIVAGACAWLEPDGWLFLEHGYDQADAVATRLVLAGFSDVATEHDLGGNPRVTCGRCVGPAAP